MILRKFSDNSQPSSRASRVARLRRSAGSSRAFTLLETMMALVIIGVGVLAFVDAQASFTQSNAWSSHAATGMLLANEIREMTRRLPRHDPVTGLTLVTGGGGAATAQGWGRESGETTVSDIDDIDDLSSVVFGAGGTYPGPVDAFGNLVPAIGEDGQPQVDQDGHAVPLEGWWQRVTVTKVDPYNFSTVRAPAYQQAASSQLPAIAVDRFPLRVTVIVTYQGPFDTQEQEVTRVTWIVPP